METDIEPIAAKLMAELSVPCKVGDRELWVTPSMGVSVFHEDGNDPAKLLSYADAAMYRASARVRPQPRRGSSA